MDMNLGDTQLILRECKARNVLRNQTAYILATAKWETAHTMKPIRERGSRSYLEGKDYFPWFGRGYVQLTWEDNYKRAGKEVGVNLTHDPDKALDPDVAVKILVAGMMEGWFTGKSLGDYVTLQRSDFVGARRVVNGTDQAETIAAIARQYDAALKQMGYGEAPQETDMTTTVPNGRLARTTRQGLLVLAGLLLGQIGFASIDQDTGVISIDTFALLEQFGWTAGALASGGGSLLWWRIVKKIGGAL